MSDDRIDDESVVGNAGDEGDEYRVFWADSVADDIEARQPTDPIVIKGGVSPSGVPHIGHFNEIMRGYYVAEVLRERGHEVRQVFTADDKDPLRKLPRKLADADWNLVDLDAVDAGSLGRNLGKPYTDIPDPFGDCHGSYGAHFTALLRESAELIGVPIEFVSNTDLYASGDFDPVIRSLLENAGLAREVLGEFQAGVSDDDVPFTPQCNTCGRLTTTVTAFDLDAGTVEYECTSLEAGGQTIDGCGDHGTVTLREGKLPWRFEWPAQWAILNVDFEPFGKDHAEGSWPSGTAIAERVLDIEPPVPLIYEWFTLDGAALSSSSGNVVTVIELLSLIDPEVLRYFFAKRPHKQRDLDLSRIDRLVDEFDRFEQVYYADISADEAEQDRAQRAYPLVLPLTLSVSGTSEPTDESTSEILIAIEKLSGVRDEPGTTVYDFPIEIDDGGAIGAQLTAEEYSEAYVPGIVAEAIDVRTTLATVRDRVFGDRVRLPFTFAAVLGMTDDRALRHAMASRETELQDETPDWATEIALSRVNRARRWAERQDNEYNYRLQSTLPDTSFEDAVTAALDDLANRIENGADGAAIQEAIYELADAHDLSPSDLFEAGYELFFGQPQGPRLGPFLAALDATFVVRRLRRID